MSPSSKSKSKSKEKHSPKTTKEQQKASSSSPKSSPPSNAYNPISGTFHSLDTVPKSPPSPLHINGARSKNADETDDHSGSSPTEYDSVSNNGSCSGESEDHKEKPVGITSSRAENIPGSDNDKREKIRQKNERKHQRQRERRAQELHERCSGYLMSRKLEMLSQQLVAMGFTSERATLALMLNEGRIQESVNWLFEESENDEAARKKDVETCSALKLDISEELAQITALEIKYKRSKQEVERAVVAFEGDLIKAEEMLRNQKPEPPVTPPKIEDAPNLKHLKRLHEKPASSTLTTQLGRNEISYTKGVMVSSSLSTFQEPVNKTYQSSQMNQSKLVVDHKRWPTTTSSSSSSLSPIPSSTKIISGFEGRNIHQGSLKEPVIMIQRPQSLNLKQQNLVTDISSDSSEPNRWYQNNITGTENTKLNAKLLETHNIGSLGAESYSAQHFYSHSQTNRTGSVEPAFARLGNSWTTMGSGAPSLTVVPSSLGLFSGWGSSGTNGVHVDWNARDMMSNCDYNSIDWTLELNASSSRSMMGNSSRLMLGLSSMRISGTNAETTSASGGPREWTSPFAGKDIFSVPRQFVTSPSP